MPNAIQDINSVYKLVTARHGLLLANPNDFYIGKAIIDYGEYSEIELRLLLQLANIADSTVIEIGANIGTHTIPLAKLLEARKVDLIAFEPQQFVFQNLCANLALNNISNVRTLPLACGDEGRTVWYKRPNYEKLGNFGGIGMSEEKKKGIPAQSVQCIRLDDALTNSKVSLLKIDVEGFEQKVLIGAQELIKSNRPILYLENSHDLPSSIALIEYLWSLDYKLFWHCPKLYNPNNFFKNPINPYPTVASINMLCLPKEREQNIQNLDEVIDSGFHPTLAKGTEDDQGKYRKIFCDH